MKSPAQIEATINALVLAAAAPTAEAKFEQQDAAVFAWTGLHISEFQES